MSLYEAYSSTPDYCSEEGQQDVATQLMHVTSFIITLQQLLTVPLPFQRLFVEHPVVHVCMSWRTTVCTAWWSSLCCRALLGVVV